MITPSFSLTATERVLPKLALDFTTAVLDSRVTFTRSGNTATVVNSSGFIQLVAADTPRFDYSPTTLQCKGLLIEESRTNNVLYSQVYNGGAYSFTETSAVDNSTVSPDNTVTACLFSETAATSQHLAFGNATTNVTSGTTHTQSIFAKAGTVSVIQLTFPGAGFGASQYANFDLANGVLGTVTGGTATISPYANGFYRITFTATATATLAIATVIVVFTNNNATSARTPSYAGNDNNNVYLYGSQFEQGAFATSYIPTEATAVTRNADVATMTGTNFSDWFNATEGTFAASFSTFTDSSNFRRIVSANDNSTANEIFLATSSSFSGRSFITTSSSQQTSFNYGAFTVNTPTKIAMAYKVDAVAGAMNGGNPSTDATATIPTVNRLEIGTMTFAGVRLNGHIQKIQYWPQRLINAEVRAFSK